MCLDLSSGFRLAAMCVLAACLNSCAQAQSQAPIYRQADSEEVGSRLFSDHGLPVSNDGKARHAHAGRPGVALPESPKKPTPQNVDTNRVFWDWQHATDDWGGVQRREEFLG